MKATVSIAEEIVPSPTVNPRATTPIVVAVVCALGMALAVTSLWLFWIGYPPTTITGPALADSAVAERVLAAVRWYMAHAPHALPLPLMHPDIGGPAVDLMVVEPKTMFA